MVRIQAGRLPRGKREASCGCGLATPLGGDDEPALVARASLIML